MKTFITIIVTFIVTVILIGVFWGMFKSKKQMAQDQSTVVRIEKPELGELVEIVNAPGEIEPKRKVDISAKISARIVEMPFKEGDRVTKGNPNATPPVPPSLLLRLDDSDLQAALKSAQARRAAQAAQYDVAQQEIISRQAHIAGVKASLHESQLQLTRQTTLLSSKDVPQSAVDQAQRQVDELKSQLQMAENDLKTAILQLEVLKHNLAEADANITRAQDNLSYTIITSPIDGVITRINAEEGEMVMTGTMNNPGTVIMVVADLSKMLVVAQVDEADIAGVREGQQAKVRIHAWPDREFNGVVHTVALSHDLRQRTGAKYFETEVLLDAEGERVFSGLTADVDIQTKKHENVLKIPSQAVLGRPVEDLPLEIRESLSEDDKKKSIATVVYRYVKDDDEKKDYKAVITPVQVSASDATHTIIISGVTAQDQVVVGPYKVLEEIKHKEKLQDEKEVEKEKKENQRKEKEERNKKEKPKENKQDKTTEEDANVPTKTEQDPCNVTK